MHHFVKELAIAEEGLVFPLKLEIERANGTLEGLTEPRFSGILDLPAEVGAATVVARMRRRRQLA